MQEIVLFLICFVLVFILYEFFIVIPMKNYKNNKGKKKKIRKEKTDPVEIKFLVYKYGVDLEKINYNKLLHVVAFVSSFDIALVVSIIALIDGYMWQMLLAIVLVIPLFLVSYGLVAKYYKKKGMIKNV